MKIVVDTNVVLDLLLDRQPFSNDAALLISEIERGNLIGYLCAATITTIHCLAAKSAGPTPATDYVHKLLSLFEIAPVTRTILEDALASKFSDFEDAVLHAAAHHVGAAYIVTRDATGFKKAAIPVCTPNEMLKFLKLLVSSGGTVPAAGREAGAVTLCAGSGRPEKDGSPADHTVPDLSGVFDTARLGLPLSGGKFPNELLEHHFTAFPFDDPSLIVQPAVGEDTAAVDIAAEEVLVLKSDPITFAADAIGQYAVLVNANDIATAGAVPRWMLTTLLFPVGTTPSEVIQVMDELQRVSRQRGITLCGGHTEISDAVTRPVVVGVMAGTVTRAGLVDKGNMRPGDRVYLTKAMSVEGTSIIARELGPRIEDLGVSADEIRRCRSFLKHISILEEAALAARCQGVSAMHDVTEGGLSTALLELAWAGGRRIRVDMDRIPVFDETRRLCRLLDIDPLGLIGSGSLLICCRPEDGDRLAAGIRAADIRITRIGEVVEGKSGVSAVQEGNPVPWPRFEVDEITRLF